MTGTVDAAEDGTAAANGVLPADGAAIDAGYGEEFVRGLVSDQFPDLAGLPLRRVSGGWDNQLWRLGDELAVRLPRTERAPELLRKEYRWLPTLAPHLPLPVSVPLRLAEPCARFPVPWTVTTWVSGEPADQAEITGAASAEALGAFLRALHRPAPADAPLSARHIRTPAQYSQDIPRKYAAIIGGPISDIRNVWREAVETPPDNGPAVWLHGDLHPANAITSGGELAGVIDFGEMGAGDRAADLVAAWLLLPEGGVRRFFAAYGTADQNVIRRARGRALLAVLGLLEVGRAGDAGEPGGKPSWGRAGRKALERILAEG